MGYKAIFLDRDNTLIEDPGYINHPNQVKLLSGTSAALVQLRRMGYKLVIVTNQSAIARGIVTEQVLGEIHQRLIELLGREGAGVDKIYFCPYHPSGVIAKYRKDSDLRKPKPGMLLKAAEEMNIDLEQSWMIGNAYHDIKAGKLAGCRTILIDSSAHPALRKAMDPVPDKKAVNIKEAVNIIKMYDQQAAASKSRVATETVPHPAATKQPDLETAKPEPEPTPTAADVHYTPAATTGTKTASEHSLHAERTHGLLEEMVRHLKNMQRGEMFEEFKLMKMLAGVVQFLVAVCLLVSFWFFKDPTRPASSVHTMIGYAIVLQLMVIAFYIMRE